MSRELNLVPRQKVLDKGKAGNSKVIIIAIIIILISVVASIGISLGSKVYYQKKLEKLNLELSRSKGKITERDTLAEQIDITNKQIEKAEQLKKLKENDTDGLLTIMRDQICVDGIEINKFDYVGKNVANKKNEVVVKGDAATKESLQKAWANLRETEGYEQSQLNKFEYNERKMRYDFELTISFEGGSDNGSTK